MYADSEEELHNSTKVIRKQPEKNFVKRTEDFLLRQKEWVLFHRRGIITRNNNTNNYSEATMRVLKDIVLERTKAFNCVALVDFFVSIWEKYTVKRLLQFAHNRRSGPRLFYEYMCKQTLNLRSELVQQSDDLSYLVPSETSDLIQFIIL